MTDKPLRLAGVIVRILLLIGLCTLSLGCSNDQLGSRLASWQGSHFNDVAAAWGAPVACSVEQPGRLCEWHVPATIEVTKSPTVGARSCITTLAFNDAGYVTGWRWRGDWCQRTAGRVAANTTGKRPAAHSVGVDEELAGVAGIESLDSKR